MSPSTAVAERQVSALDLVGRIEAMAPERRRALVEALDRDGARYDVYRLTGARRRMWLLSQLRPESPVYNVSYRFDITGRVDADALGRALETVVARHDALRSVYLAVDGEPRQVVLAPGEVRSPLQVVDLEPAARDRDVDERVARESRRPFDLARGPVLRARLLRRRAARSVLVLTVHHIACDGWSMRILYDDLAAAYAAHRDGREPALPALPRAVEVARRQDESLDAASRERLLGFWRDALDGAPRTLDLLTDRPRPAVPGDGGDQVSVSFAPAVAARVAALARRCDATPFAVLLAACQALLHRYSGQRDIVVGCPVAGRHEREAEDVVGLFVNTVALRARLSDSMTFAELVAQARDASFAALGHQKLPFDVLVDELDPRRETSAQPLFSVMVSAEDGEAERLVLGDLDVRGAESHTATAKFDLTFVPVLHGERLDARIEYRTELFHRATIERLGGHLRTLLAAAVRDPERAVADLPLMSSRELDALSQHWAGPAAPAHEGRPVHALVDDVARATPGAPAVVYGDDALSYRELDERACAIAASLRAAGVGPEVAVGVCLERCPDLVAAFLGVLKAGGVYVPLDAQLPDERLRYLVEDSAVAVVLTHAPTASRVPSCAVALDVNEIAAGGPASRPEVAVTPESAAYVIYTSGSTGKPKGVVCTHGGLRNLAEAQRELVGVGPRDRVLQFHSPSFDVSVSDFVTVLCAGAQLVLATPEELLPGPDLQRTLRDRRITVADLPPVALGAMDPADLSDLHTLTVGGEACPLDVARRWSAGRRFFNAYGPTEATVTVTAARFQPGAAVLPIGTPLHGVRAYVLDDRRRPVPIGVAGELWVGGAGVARGYLGDPELTAQRFVDDPFFSEGRMYRTGDLVRMLAGGELEFLGRADSQVKVRGYRIELGEIESRLRACAGVERCAVIVREDAPGAVRLVAYVIGDGLRADGLRGELQRHLPRYMLPEAFVFVDDLPLNSSGKLDRRALPVPSDERPALDASFVAPRGTIEKQIAAVWRDVLGVARVGVDDNFFDLGGNSMLVAKVRARLEEELGADVPVLEFFRRPTVGLLARRLAPPAATTDAPAAPRAGREVAEGRRALAQRGRLARSRELSR